MTSKLLVDPQYILELFDEFMASIAELPADVQLKMIRSFIKHWAESLERAA
jgi:lipase chaperone LimK